MYVAITNVKYLKTLIMIVQFESEKIVRPEKKQLLEPKCLVMAAKKVLTQEKWFWKTTNDEKSFLFLLLWKSSYGKEVYVAIKNSTASKTNGLKKDWILIGTY